MHAGNEMRDLLVQLLIQRGIFPKHGSQAGAALSSRKIRTSTCSRLHTATPEPRIIYLPMKLHPTNHRHLTTS